MSQNKIRSGPRLTLHDDLEPFLEDLHPDLRTRVIQLRDRVESGPKMIAWLEANQLAMVADDMVNNSEGTDREAAKRLHAVAMHLLTMAKNGG